MNKLRILLFIQLICLIQISLAQEDTLQIKKYLKTALSNQADSALGLQRARAALSLALKSNNELIEAQSYDAIAQIYYAHHVYSEGRTYWNKAIQIYSNKKDTNRLALAEIALSRLFDVLGHLDSSISLAKHGLELCQKTNNPECIARAYISISAVQFRLGLLEEFKETTYRALHYAQKANNPELLIPIYGRLGIYYFEAGLLDSSRHFFLLENELDEKYPDFHNAGVIPANLATVEHYAGNYKKALELYKISVEKFGGINSITAMESTLGVLDCYYSLGELDSTIEYGKKILKIASELGDIKRLNYTYRILSNAEEDLNHPTKSLEYYKEYHLYNDSLLRMEYDENLREMESSIQLDMQKSINEELENSRNKILLLLSKNKMTNYILTGLVALLVVLIIIMSVNFKRIRTQKNSLDYLNDQLLEKTNSLEENNKHLAISLQFNKNLVSVIAHDLKHPFENIQSILQSVMTQIHSDVLKNTLNLASRMSTNGLYLIKDLVDLSRNEEHNPINAGPKEFTELAIKPLILQAISNHQFQFTNKNITLHLDVTDGKIRTKEDHLIRIIDNLVSNALKYSPLGSEVWIKSTIQDNVFKLIIRDSGPGFQTNDLPKLFTPFAKLSARPSGGEPSTGLGLNICKKLATGLGGTIELISQPEEPAIFEFQLPINKTP